MAWLLVLLVVLWLVFRKRGPKGDPPELATLRGLVEQYAETQQNVQRERLHARTLTGRERAAAFARLEAIEHERAKAAVHVESLRNVLEARGLDVSALRLPTNEEAEDAAILEEARAEVERELSR